ncbi:hypothetical protein [Nocardia sp. NRRL S-836]|uniref:hypothetical protein n=1 Tax=Nocardia sp. NRRL S-836 TaxID=1519492 RepID=UPI0006AF5B15|nr:hypothetical protein [Nocardia sp. NRRL S-836]
MVAVAVQHLIYALIEDWDRINDLLGENGRARLHSLVDRMRGAVTPVERAAAAHEVTKLLGDLLPHDDRVFADAGVRYASTAQLADLDLALVRLSDDVRLGGRPRGAKERILTNDWESAADLRERGHNPDVLGVIKLHRDDGSASVPTFQFDATGEPLDVVLRINLLLHAHRDPWGAADWWFSANVWLRERPVTLIGRAPDDELVAAAAAVVEG